jgi:hypothetical protein
MRSTIRATAVVAGGGAKVMAANGDRYLVVAAPKNGFIG